MKRVIFVVMAILVMLAALAATACAVEVIEVAADVAQGVGAIEQVAESGGGGTIPTELFTWQVLGTIAGCTAFVLLFVQLIKAPLDKVWKIPTRLLVYVVCLVLMLASAVFSGDGLSLNTALLAVANAVIPTLLAIKTYELTLGRNKNI